MPGNKKQTSEKFVDGEKVLCYHGPLLYEAKEAVLVENVLAPYGSTLFGCGKFPLQKVVPAMNSKHSLLLFGGRDHRYYTEQGLETEPSSTSSRVWILFGGKICLTKLVKMADTSDLQVFIKAVERVITDESQELLKIIIEHYMITVTKMQSKDKTIEYLIHYNGWSKSWDEWVNEDRIQKVNEATLQKQRDLLQQFPQAERQKKIGSKRKMDKKKESDILLRKRRTRFDTSECSTRDSSPQRQELYIVYTEEMKKRLVDDWDLVTRQKQLVNIPKQLTVAGILKQFQEHSISTKPDSTNIGQLTEVCGGLKDYFDVMLGTQLLYKFERPQYADILIKYSDKGPSEIFGIEHFLRLFVRLNSMLTYTVIEEDNLMIIQTHIQDIIKYIDDNLSLMVTDYDPAPAEYLRRQT